MRKDYILMNNNKKASIVIPAYNSQDTIDKLVSSIFLLFPNENLEVVIVNDNSEDQTHKKCLEIYNKFSSSIIYIKLRKNYGEHNAVMAGLNYCSGEKIFIMDDDFQNSPEDLRKLYDYSFQNAFDIVYVKYKKKKHNFFRNFLSKLNDKFVNFIFNKPKNIYLSSFKSIDRSILDEILSYDGPSPYIDGIILNLTSNIGQVEVDHQERLKGNSNYTFYKLLKLFSNVFFNFSTRPLHVISIIGILISIFSIFFSIFIIIEKFLNPSLPLGYASLTLIILFFSGVQFFLIGILGEYIGRVLNSVNKKPQFSIEKIFQKQKKNND